MWQKIGILAFWLGWPLLRIYFLFGERTRVIITSPAHKILLVKGWIGDGKWGIPGGGVHRGEEPVKGAIREVLEETGLQLKPNQFKKIEKSVLSERGLKYKYTLYQVKLTSEPKLTRGHEITDIIWQPLDDLTDVSKSAAHLLSRSRL